MKRDKPKSKNNEINTLWIEKEILPDELISLLKDKITWLNFIWNGNLPTERDLFCQFIEEDCEKCKHLLFEGKTCATKEFMDGNNLLSASNSGWKILSKKTFVEKDLPSKDNINAQLFLNSLIKHYNKIITKLKSTYITDIILMNIDNNTLVTKSVFDSKVLNEATKKEKIEKTIEDYVFLKQRAPKPTNKNPVRGINYENAIGFYEELHKAQEELGIVTEELGTVAKENKDHKIATTTGGNGYNDYYVPLDLENNGLFSPTTTRAATAVADIVE